MSDFLSAHTPLTRKESGRSMVEMLGVLAIGGVLSVGGVALFRSAMDRIKMNALSSWITQMELAFYERCFYQDNDSCSGENGIKYDKARALLCTSTFGGADFCDDTTTNGYVPLKFIPNVQWTSGATKTTWSLTFVHLTETQCEQFFNMDLPKNTYRMNTSQSSVAFTSTPAILTDQQKSILITRCKEAAQNDANWGGVFSIDVNMK